MRSRLTSSTAVLAMALGALALLPSGIDASPSAEGSSSFAARTDFARTVSPLWAVGLTQQANAATGSPIQSLAGLSLEDTRERVNDTAVELRVAMLLKETDDRYLAEAQGSVNELRQETSEIAETTVENAITNYRQTDLNQNLLELDDLNQGLRANALGDAAIIADTESFDRYRNKSKDLEMAEMNLSAETAENIELTAQVVELQSRLEYEQSWLADLEERTLQSSAKKESAVESIWAQSLGTKQGFYLRTCPVKGDHSFIDSWGFARSGGRRHKGVDIMAKTGTPIVAPANGVVSYRSNSVGGRSFHLTDEFGNYYYGTHMSAYGDIEGEVRAGQVIGYVGEDGNAAGIPHLHFEIHAGGRGNQINPFADSAAVCDGAQF